MNNLDVYGYLMFFLTELPKFQDIPTKDQLESVMLWNNKIPKYCKNQKTCN